VVVVIVQGFSAAHQGQVVVQVDIEHQYRLQFLQALLSLSLSVQVVQVSISTQAQVVKVIRRSLVLSRLRVVEVMP
jgi:hypothetical protein